MKTHSLNLIGRSARAFLALLIASQPLAQTAQAMTLAQAPLYATTNIKPNILVVLDNSESMDGTMTGKLIAGDDASTRSNIARQVLRNNITNNRANFNWGLESFNTSSRSLLTTYAYFIGSNTEVVYTNDCVGGISASNNGLRCIANPEPGNGYNYITYRFSGDDPSINDVLYSSDYGPVLYGIGVTGTTNYNVWMGHNSSAGANWKASSFNNGFNGAWSFTPTDAGFLPQTPPHNRIFWIKRAWGYAGNTTGSGTINRAVQTDSAANYTSLMNLLANETNSSSAEVKNDSTFTPLAGALGTASAYFSGTTSPITASCQKNFVLLATDGNPTAKTNGSMYSLTEMANTFNASTGAWTFGAASTDTFAKVTALRTTPNNSVNYDVKTFVIGLGDSLANPSSIAALNRIADLGGTGTAHLATNAADLEAAFNAVSSTIIAMTSSSSSVSTNSTSLNTGTQIYQARFNTSNWSGQVLSFDVNTNGTISSTPNWESGSVMAGQAPGSRVIFTNNPGSGAIPFRWGNLPSGMQTSIGASTTLDYLRGDRSHEGSTTGLLRVRGSVLGDVINSNPNYVGAPRAGYVDSDYLSFVRANSNRTPTIYVGSNDGMLHAINAKTGAELWGFVPMTSVPTMAQIASQTYVHRYLVDGTPNVADAKVNSNWMTVLASSMGAGGQSVFALDVTDPSTYTETNAASRFQWEFTDAHDAQLGNMLSEPKIVKLNNDKWAVVFGNGVNNAKADGHAGNGKAALFILFLDRAAGSNAWVLGTDYVRIDVPTIGSTTAENGISSIATADINRDGKVDYIYGGDLYGNLWKFDLRATASSGWGLGNGGSPLFTARDASNNLQPITTGGIEVLRNPAGGRVIVFGTGKYLETGDLTDTHAQAFYGIKDDDTTRTWTKADLQQQSVLDEQAANGQNYRLTTTNTVDWNTKGGWYMNLPGSGERVVFKPILRGQRVVFVTLIPATDPCAFGGTSWTMEVDALTGARLSETPFDVNGDNLYTTADMVNFVKASVTGFVSGRSSSIGITSYPTVIQSSTVSEIKIMSGSSGKIETFRESAAQRTGRISWREVLR